ncbi:MAG: DHH family phosphoesterase [Patescibacteria group bacterium]
MRMDTQLSPRDQLLSLPPNGKGLLVYHWDTDGVTSAALLLNFLAQHKAGWQIDLLHPTIGNYFLLPAEYERIRQGKYDLIMCVDLNFTLETIEELEKTAPAVLVFDHHVQTRDIQRPGKQDVSFPGNSFLVNSALENPVNVTAILGMVGDQEERLKEREDFFPFVELALQGKGKSFDDVLRLTKLIDTNYITLDSAGLERMIALVRKDPLFLLEDPVLLEKQKLIDETLNTAQTVTGVPVGKFGLEFNLESPLHLLSEYTRALSRRFPDNIVMVTQMHPTYANIYLRRRNLPFDLSPFVDLARAQGCNAGGKVEVAGLIIPLDKHPEFLKQVRHNLQAYGA